MSSISSLLQKYLDELVQNDFKSFKSFLMSSRAQGFDPISRSRLESADQLDVVELMVNQYGESEAADITVRVLKQIKQNKIAADLEKELKDLDGNASGGKRVFFFFTHI